MARIVFASLLLASLLGPLATRGDEPPAAAPTSGVLLFSNGDDLPGAPADSAQPGQLGWSSPAFTRPFQFDAKLLYLKEARFEGPNKPAWTDSDYRFSLAGGDVLYGDLVALGKDELTIDSKQAGRIRVKRAAVQRIESARRNGATLYSGPSTVDEWKVSPRADAWRDDEGRLSTDQPFAALWRDFELPARAAIELEISWSAAPDFTLSFGVSDDPAAKWPACCFEVIAQDLILQRETERDLDVAKVIRLEPEGRLRLHVLVDQERQQIDAFTGEGAFLATVRTSKDRPQTLTGISLQHKRGGLRLEHLRVSRFSGEVPKGPAANRPRMHRADGAVVYGVLTGYDASRRQFSLATDEGPVVVGQDQLDSLYLKSQTPDESPTPPARVACADGTRLSGSFDRIAGDRLFLECPAALDGESLDALSLPLSAVRSLRFQHRISPPTKAHRETLVLELDGGSLHGVLADVTTEDAQGRLYWQPLGSSTASPLRGDISGRIDFAAKRLPGRPAALARDADKLYLRAGDIYRCEIIRSDERGVWFRAGGADEQQVSHDMLKAVELGQQPVRVELAEDKRKRLLTLPRLLKDDPPTHILCSVSGDYLRGRLLSLSAAEVRFDVNGSEHEFPRRLIAQIIWLHADELDAEGSPPETLKPPAGRVQVVRIDGSRVTFTPQEFKDGWLSGVSELLGACRVHIDQESELLIGDRVLRQAAELPYSQWRLTSAVEPIAARAVATSGGAIEDGGADSILIGRSAPDFELSQLDGKVFTLSDERGKIVVLDFWAGWCAPCMQSLPKIAETIAALDPQKVMLVTVNLQQTAEEAEDALRRLKLNVPVALDRNGKTAEKYGASSIPFTVVIGPDGKVGRVFVGSNPRLPEQLRKAIEALQSSEPPLVE